MGCNLIATMLDKTDGCAEEIPHQKTFPPSKSRLTKSHFREIVTFLEIMTLSIWQI